MTAPLFTIATMCYNHERFLDEYFQSLLAQTYDNVQLIIHDDRSTDGSWAKIQHYLPQVREKFTEVICERSETNRGMWGSYLYVTDAARLRGKYFSLLESDDYYLPDRIRRVVDYFEAHPDVGFIHSAAEYLRHDTATRDVYHANQADASGWVFEKLLNDNFISQCSVAFRTDILNAIDLQMLAKRNYKMGDYPVSLAAARLTQFGYIDEPLVVYRVHPGSASRPGDPLRQYEFGKSSLQIKIDAAVDGSAPEATIQKLKHRYHAKIFTLSARAGVWEDYQRAVEWLKENSPETLESMPNRIKTWLYGHRGFFESPLRIRISRGLYDTLKKIYYSRYLQPFRGAARRQMQKYRQRA